MTESLFDTGIQMPERWRLKNLSREIAIVGVPDELWRQIGDPPRKPDNIGENYYRLLMERRASAAAGEKLDDINFLDAVQNDPEMTPDQKILWIRLAADEWFEGMEKGWRMLMKIYFFVGKALADEIFPGIAWADIPVYMRRSILWQVRMLAGIDAKDFSDFYGRFIDLAAEFFEPPTEAANLISRIHFELTFGLEDKTPAERDGLIQALRTDLLDRFGLFVGIEEGNLNKIWAGPEYKGGTDGDPDRQKPSTETGSPGETDPRPGAR